MKRYCLLFLILVFNLPQGFSQKKNDVLLTINNDPVYVSEFKRVYKKNLDLVKDESQKTVDGYLKLFIDYKLKIAEAYEQELHKQTSYIEEFEKYEEQLSRNYIYDTKVTDELVVEGYERSLEEIEASHLLISVNYNASPQDTLKAYNTIKKLRERAVAGEDFTELVKNNSTEPKARDRGGYLGYFTAFAMVYPFETAAYNTPVGQISEIVRTQFGYHIIKVTDRRPKGKEISVSHIMVTEKDDDSRTFKPEERIQEIYQLLKQGQEFEKLAEQYSDDKNSAVRGGKLKKFSRGSLRSVEFEEKAFSLEEEGEVTEPFKSEFGWHIVRLDKYHSIPPFESLKPELEKKVKDGDRSKIVISAISNKIKDKFGFTKGEPFKEYFVSYLPDDVLKRSYYYDSIPPVADKTIFTIGDKVVKFEDFARYIEKKQKRMLKYKDKDPLVVGLYEEFEVDVLKDFYRAKLEEENEEYASTIDEYRNGLLIFDLMDKNIWQRAKEDSLGLQKYFEANRDQYKWGERIEAMIVAATSEEKAHQALEMIEAGKTEAEIKDAMNSEEQVNVIITAGTFEVHSRELPKGFEIKKGVSEIYNEEGSFVVINITEIIPPGHKELDEVRGKALNDFQNHLETEWINSLRNKFEVEVNNKSLKKLKKEFKS